MANTIEILIQVLGGQEADKSLMAFGAKLAAVGASVAMIGSSIENKFSKPIRGAFGEAVEEAALLQESMSLTAQVFGEMGDEVIGWAREMSETYLLSTSELLTHTGLLTKMLEQTGMGAGEAFPMVQELVERSTDLALMYNKEVPEALSKFKSGMSDNIRPLREFGIFLDQATIKAKAVEMGLVETSVSQAKLEQATIRSTKAQEDARKVLQEYGVDSMEYREALNKVDLAEENLAKIMEGKTGALKTAEKIQAKYALVMEQSAYAVGFAATESENWMYVQHQLEAAWKNFLAEAMLPLLPVLADFLQLVIAVIKWFADLDPKIQGAIFAFLALVAVLGPIVLIIGQIIIAVAGLVVIWGVIGATVVAALPIIAAAFAVITVLIIAFMFLVAALLLVWFTWGEEIKDIVQRTVAFFKRVWINFQKSFAALQEAWIALTEGRWSDMWTFLKIALVEFGKGMALIWGKIWGNFSKKVHEIWSNLKTSFKETISDWYEAGKNIIQALIDGIKDKASALVSAAKDAAWNAYQAALTVLGIQSPSRLFVEIGRNMMRSMAMGIQQQQGTAAQASANAAGIAGRSVINNYYLTARYEYQSPSSLRQDVRLLQLMDT